jgi:hypothetical protein
MLYFLSIDFWFQILLSNSKFLVDPCHVPWSKPAQVTRTKELSFHRLKSSLGDCGSHAYA